MTEFKVTLDALFAHGAGIAFRIGLACFFNDENQIRSFRDSFVKGRRFLKPENTLGSALLNG